MKRAVIFGDSNTYGRIPGTEDGRFSYPDRWTSILQERLGEGWEVCSEGYPGRTVLQYEKEPAMLYAPSSVHPALKAHLPFSYVMIMLGTNDFKTVYDVSPETVAEGLAYIVDEIRRLLEMNRCEARIVLAAPPVFQPAVPEKAILFRDAREKMTAYSQLVKQLAEQKGTGFIDLSDLLPDPADGIHLPLQLQPVTAELVMASIEKEVQG